MSFYALTGFINAASTAIMGSFVLSRARNDLRHQTFGLTMFAIAWWSLFYGFWVLAKEREAALLFARLFMVGCVFIPACLLHHVLALLGGRRVVGLRGLVRASYATSVALSLLCATRFMVRDVRHKLQFTFWPDFGTGFIIFTALFMLDVCLAVGLIGRNCQSSAGQQRLQLGWYFWGTLIGFVGGSTNFFLCYDIPIPPFGNVVVPFYALLAAIAVVRHQFMSIRIAITRTGILIGIYVVVLGLPFILGFAGRSSLEWALGKDWWLVPLCLSTTLATIGPFAYAFLRGQAEERLLNEQRRYQRALQHAARGMTRVRNPNKLAGLIVRVVSRTVRVQHATLLLMDEEHQELVLVASQGPCRLPVASWLLSQDAELMRWIMGNRKVLAVDAIEDPAELPLRRELEFLQASIVVPGFIEDRLVGLLILGRKLSGVGYSSDDLHAFSMLANEAAIALENAKSYEALLKANDELRRAHERLLRQERLAAAGQFAAGMAHEIKNPLSAIKTFAEFLPEKYHDHSFRQRFFRIVQSEIDRISTLVRELMDFAKPAPLELHPVKVSRLLGETLDLLSDHSRRQGVEVRVAFRENGSQLKADPNQLKQVFLNILLNSLEAMPAGGTLRVETDSDHASVRIRIIDSGIGISEEHRKRLFDPFFTTKERGMGLGLAIVKGVMDRHGGQIVVRSEPLQGTTFELAFPVVEPSRATV